MIRLPFAQCFTLHGGFPCSRTLIFSVLIFCGVGRVICCLNETRLREGEGLARAQTAANWPKMECAPQGGETRQRSPSGSCRNSDAHSHAFSDLLGGWGRWPSGEHLSRDVQATGGLRRRGLGGAAVSWGRGLDLREAAHPAYPWIPSLPKLEASFLPRGCGACAGRGGGGGHPGGDPVPPLPAAWRPHTHVNAGPARIPPAAQRFAAPRGYLGLLVLEPALLGLWRVPAAQAGRFAGLRLLHPGAARRPRRGQAAPAAPGAGEWEHRGCVGTPWLRGDRGSELLDRQDERLARPTLGSGWRGAPCARVPISWLFLSQLLPDP